MKEEERGEQEVKEDTFKVEEGGGVGNLSVGNQLNHRCFSYCQCDSIYHDS